MVIQSKEDLSRVLPSAVASEVLNYGQGEGQIQIDGTVWGLYVNGPDSYRLCFEEGQCSIPAFQRFVSMFIEKITAEFGAGIQFNIQGSWPSEI